jgi:hypothetical protein
MRIRILERHLSVEYTRDYVERTLGADAGPALLEIAGADVIEARLGEGTATFVLSPEAAKRLGDRWQFAQRAFEVEQDGARILSGIVYEAIGAAAIRAPVMAIWQLEGRTVLGFGPRLGAWLPPASGELTGSRASIAEVSSLFRTWHQAVRADGG